MRETRTSVHGKSLVPLEGTSNLHTKLQSLRAKLSERGVYSPAREASTSKQFEPPKAPMSTGIVGHDPRVSRAKEVDKGGGKARRTLRPQVHHVKSRRRQDCHMNECRMFATLLYFLTNNENK